MGSAEGGRAARWLPAVALVSACLIWASSFIALKFTFRALDPMVVIFGRMALGSACVLFLLRRIDPPDYRAGDWRAILFMALCEPCLYFLFEAAALQRTSASQAGVITAMLPLLVGLAAVPILKERVSGRTLGGFSLAIGGAVWLSLAAPPAPGAPDPRLGNLLEFMAMVCATGYTITLKRLSSRFSPLWLTGAQAAIGTLFYLPLLLLPGTDLPRRFDPAAWLAVAYLGIVVTLGAYLLYTYGVSRIPATQAAAFVNLIPVFSALLGWWALGERFTPAMLGASLLILAGVFVSQAPRSAGGGGGGQAAPPG
jgi:drug/metabolite transporter (DMT)-like permease